MRIRYTYQNYPSCPKATEYSRSSESSAAFGGMFLSLFSFAAAITFLICTFSFFENYNWGEFLGSIAFATVMSFLNFYYFVCHPNNTACEIKVILTEESNHDLPQNVVQEYCNSIRNENSKKNIRAFKTFCPFYFVFLFNTIALIAGIKGVYFIYQGGEGVILLVSSVIGICFFSFFLVLWLKNRSVRTKKKQKRVDKHSNDNVSIPHVSDIAFCRKCGAKIMQDDNFCFKCGTKVK